MVGSDDTYYPTVHIHIFIYSIDGFDLVLQIIMAL